MEDSRDARGVAWLSNASARVLSSPLFNVSRFDLVSFGVSTLILLGVALAACLLPARRACSVDPSLTLRVE